MLHISGQRDTLRDLMVKEGFEGSLTEYEQQFVKRNPHLCQDSNYKQALPPYAPLFLVTESSPEHFQSEAVKEILQFTQEERKTLRLMQDQQHDVPTQVAMTDIMKELQSYASSFRKWLKQPLVVTPWKDINTSLTEKSLFKLLGETSKYSSACIEKYSHFHLIDRLYEDMLARDVLNRQLHMLRHANDSSSQALKRELEKQIKELTSRIKQELPKKISATKSKFIQRFTSDEIRKMRANCYSAKSARTGKLLTTNIDVLNKSGLSRLRIMIKGLKALGNHVNKGATLLNYGVVAYDAVEAYRNVSTREAAKTFITGASAVYLTSQAVSAIGGTSALGGLVLGTIGGDIALGGTILISSPVLGWVVVIVAGAAAGGYLAYKAKGLLEEVWDISEEVGSYIYQEASKAAGFVHDELFSAWKAGSEWVLDFYESKN